MARLLYRLGVTSARHRFLVITAWAVLVVGLAAAAVSGMRFDDGGFKISDSESSRALAVVEREFPSPPAEEGSGALRLVLFTEGGGRIGEGEARAAVAEVLASAATADHVVSATDPFDVTRPYVSPDGTTAVSTLVLRGITDDNREAVESAVADLAEQARERGLGAEVGGSISDPVPEVFGPTEVVGAVLAFAVLLLTYGSLAAAGANMLGALLGVAVGVLGVLASSVVAPIGSTTPILAVMLGLAVGIDYCLFVVARFRAELREGRPVHEAIGHATGTAGSAVVFAGGTVVIALAGLAVVGIGFITEMGLAAAFAVTVAVLMSLTLLPAMLRAMGTRALPRRERTGRRNPARADRIGFLDRWIRLVVRRPVTVLVVAVAGLLVLATPVLSLTTSLSTPGGEDPDSTQRAAYERVADAFGAGHESPLVVLAEGEGVQARLADVTSVLAALDGVVSVVPAGVNAAGDTALVQVVPATGPVDERTERLVHDIRTQDVAGVSLLVTGQTAVGIDTDERLSTALVTYLVVIVGLSLLLLVIVFRSLLVPLVATVGFLLSLGAGLGVTVAVFQWGWLDPVFQAPQGNPMLSLLPVLIVGILFGLAMDYQVFLVSRMHEAHARGLNPVEAVLDGFGRTAVVVVSAATIMTAVFAGFALSLSSLIGSIGLALTAGVVADAFVVRMIVVPALLTLLGESAWWLPRWLDRALPNLDAEGRALADNPAPVVESASLEAVGR